MSATVHRFPHSPPRLRVVNGADVEARRRETLGSDENGPMLVLTWWDWLGAGTAAAACFIFVCLAMYGAVCLWRQLAVLL